MATLPAPGIFTTLLQICRSLIGLIPEFWNVLLNLIYKFQATGIIIYEIFIILLLLVGYAIGDRLAPIIKKLFNWGLRKFE